MYGRVVIYSFDEDKDALEAKARSGGSDGHQHAWVHRLRGSVHGGSGHLF